MTPSDSEFMLRHWQSLTSQRDKLIASLGEKNLPDTHRRRLINALVSTLRIQRRWLREAEELGAVSTTDLPRMKLKCVEAGAVALGQQERALSVILNLPRLPVQRYCALIHLFCKVIRMTVCLEKERQRALQQTATKPTGVEN
jgi:hypothetical protein